MARRKQLWKHSKRTTSLYRPHVEILEDRLAPSTVTFSDFASTAGLVLSGNTTVQSTTDGNVLRLVPAVADQLGGAFTSNTFSIASGFSTSFAFRATRVSSGGEGFTFTLQTGTGLGSGDDGLGYQGLTDSITVEFDTRTDSGEASSNHLAIHVDGGSSSIAEVHVGDFLLDDGDLKFVWIEYDGRTLEVRIEATDVRPDLPRLQANISIPEEMQQNIAHVGFTASTDSSSGDYDILNWQFSNDASIPQPNSIIRVGAIGASAGNQAADAIFAADAFLQGFVDRSLTTAQFNALTPAQLRASYDVLLITSSSDSALNLDWDTRLLPFMELGGSVIFEDPNNFGDLAAILSAGPSSISGLGSISSVTGLTEGIDAEFFTVSHVFTNLDPALHPFLFFNGDTAGVYGEFGRGRIVITGSQQDADGDQSFNVDEFFFLINELKWSSANSRLHLSGNGAVLQGQTYTLNLTYDSINSSDYIEGVIVDWGDGSPPEFFVEFPSSVTHVFHDAPNGYLITARAAGAMGDFPSTDSLLVTVTVPEDTGTQASSVVEAGNTETFTVGGVSTTTTNNSLFNNIIITLGVYRDNPADKLTTSVTTIGGVTFLNTPFGMQAEAISYELRATTPLPGDIIVARFTIPNVGFMPNLFFFDEVTRTYLPVRGSTKIPNSFVQIGNVFQVIFDETSFPSSLGLNGTVFTITDASALAPSLVTVVQTPPPALPVTSANAFNNLLDIGGGPAPTGSTVGVVAPTQVNAFTGQNTGAGDSPEAEGRRLSRRIQSALDGVYEQMRSIFLPQVYFDPSAVEPPPSADTSVPVELAADAPAWAREEIALTPPTRGRAIEIALAPAPEKGGDTPVWLFSERALVCLSIAALPMMAAIDRPAPRRKRKVRR